MRLEQVLRSVAVSPPFEKLLLQRSRPIIAQAPAGAEVIAATLAETLETPILLIAPGPHEATALTEGVSAYLGRERVAEFPAWEALPYEVISPSPEVAAQRFDAVYRLRQAETSPFVLVAPAVATLQRLVPTIGAQDGIELVRGANLPEQIGEHLVALGYSRTDLVEHRGEFAMRGGIVDVFPGTARRPVRIELFGDEIESIRSFVPATQLSAEPLQRVDVSAVRELIATEDLRKRALGLAPQHEPRFRDLLTRFGDGLIFEGMETLAPLLFEQLEMRTLAELLPEGAWVLLSQSRRTIDRAQMAYEEAEAIAEATGWPGPSAMSAPDEAVGSHVQLHLSEMAEGLDLGFEDWGTALGNAPELGQRIVDLTAADYRVIVAAEGQGSLDRAREVLADRDATLVRDTSHGAPDGPPDDTPITGVEADLPHGFIFAPGKIAVATEEELFGSRRHTRRAPRMVQRRADTLASELEPGDFVVHRVHGIAQFDGVVHREIGGGERDYLVLVYAKGDKLFVPSDQVGVVDRYTGGEKPTVHRMGSKDWDRTKAKVKKSVKDIAAELVRLYSVRMSIPGHAFGPDTPWQRELEDAFPHDETDDQLVAIDDVKVDMQQARPMDRLICGDVGYGKTEIAVRAAFKAVMDGKQAAILVPTTLLAEQHSVTFAERYAPFPVKVKMLSRFLSKSEQDEVVAGLGTGDVDVVIGTHRLLGKDIAFKDLGLVVIDEEQRFGVSHKEGLKKLRAQVDALAMTATPIPRTMEMALTGIREMSTVDTPPEDRQPVLTFVGPYDEAMAVGALRRELLRGGQVFWLHNRVATLDRQAAWIQERVPEARVVVAHGQMDEDRLEKEMMRFWDRDADVLVCTTIIESGLDVPNANTLIADGADRLGLAQMYQLRGRVGRSKDRAFAYFFFPPQHKLTEEAHERLATISRHTQLGSGFKIALRDLEIRGAGNLLGAQQHGHIASVGFETYCNLLAEAVAEMKGETVVVEQEIRVDLPVRGFIPPDWIHEESLRLDLYRRIAVASTREALVTVLSETRDRFGALPAEVGTLFSGAALKLTATAMGVTEVNVFKDDVRIKPIVLDDLYLSALSALLPGATYHQATSTLNLPAGLTPGTELARTIELALCSVTGEPEPADILLP